ncbi:MULTISPECIES: hypothetical protein [unclassified Exiguobacterium]|uniref:hypothetical protein n=1 Tax=unclassified Exiguobacterium TaxID=2644629 RepID=UPI00103FF2A2|nr:MULTISPECIES: hypothetical protein [unclassified Exiguobacterium]TCI35773.1 hypothetical protein EVJ29_09975 [Exiguobacterium sp. SH4S7]TCI43436.1 hypothetical protein EVJ31_11210 [Exiguobacterium sp. SH5S32]TCI52384.1 hypothetical protein EVJ25_06405 [Exiguobacterium sp. SH1S4]TCI65151.1 hypothetical protein EVJ21_00725 [Exiguobacterium sp. SH0S2]TCI68691.1 hypothetical protein EVJ23_11200 [Exiguobacterium sp. SH1S1]
MRIVDARAMSISHEDLIAVTESSVYYREKTGETSFSIFRYDEADGTITQINRRVFEDYGISKLFISADRVYFLNETPDRTGVVSTELIAFDYRTGDEEVLTTFEKRGNSTLYWVLADRYFLFLTSFEATDEAWLFDAETSREERIRDERLVGHAGRFRELYLFTTELEGVSYIVCNARLDEFDYYDALESGRISPDDPIDHSEAILICPLDEAVEAVWSKADEIPFDDLIRLQGEGDTVQYLGERDKKLRFAAFIDAANEETVYELAAPDVLHELAVVDWGAYEPIDFTYDDVSSTIFIKVEESMEHTELIDATTGARFLDTSPFERVLDANYFIHESADGRNGGVSIFNLEANERQAFEDAYYTVLDETIVILSTKQL